MIMAGLHSICVYMALNILLIARLSLPPNFCRFRSRHGQLSALVQVVLLIGMESVFLVMRVMLDRNVCYRNRKETVDQ